MSIFDEPLLTEKHQAIWDFLRSCSLPVYCATERSQVPVGTGTLVEIAGCKYLMTAGHVANLQGKGHLALPTDMSFRGVTTLGPCTVLRAALDKHDVAIVPLEDEEVIARLDRWRFLQLDHLGTPWLSGPYLLFGHLAPTTAGPGLVAPGTSVGIIVAKYAGSVPDSALPPDPDYDMLLDWPGHLLEAQDGPVDTPRLQGLSGASIWAVEPDCIDEQRIWTPESRLRMVAIQSAATHGQYIRAKRIHLLWSALRDLDKKGASAFRRALTGHRKGLEQKVKEGIPRKPRERNRNGGRHSS